MSISVKDFGTPELLIQCEAEVGEGPVWDYSRDVLCWVDLTQGDIYEKDFSSGAVSVSNIGMMVGAIAPRLNKEGFAVACEDGFGFWNGEQLDIVDESLSDSSLRMNDAKCDAKGRLWAGSNHKEFVPGLGKLHKWDSNLKSSIEASNLILPNGIGWSPDNKTMYLADSFAQKVYSAPYDLDEGDVGVFTEFISTSSGLPDGLAVDMEGCIWLAIWGESVVNRYDSKGNLIWVIPMPVSQPSSCAIGREGKIYLTSARSGISAQQLKHQPLAGSVFILETDIPGVPIMPFAG